MHNLVENEGKYLTSSHSDLEGELEDSIIRVASLERHISSIETSKSWRITAPLRLLKDRLDIFNNLLPSFKSILTNI